MLFKIIFCSSCDAEVAYISPQNCMTIMLPTRQWPFRLLTATISFFTVPPEFVIPLSETTCETGETVILKCKVCGRPKASITWKGPDHNTLSNGSHYSISCRYWASLNCILVPYWKEIADVKKCKQI